MEDFFTAKIKCLSSEAIFSLEIPTYITVQHTKELLKQYHPRHPAVAQQKIIHNGSILANSEPLFSQIKHPEKAVYLSIDDSLPSQETAYTSNSFKSSEVFYMLSYRRLLTSITGQIASQPTSLIPPNSILACMPLCHPLFKKRIEASRTPQARPVRLYDLRCGRLLDFSIFIRTFSFFIIAHMMGQQFNSFIITLSFVLYLIQAKRRIATHRESQLARLPADYLRLILPAHTYEEVQFGHGRRVAMTVASFFWSMLPWFEPGVSRNGQLIVQ